MADIGKDGVRDRGEGRGCVPHPSRSGKAHRMKHIKKEKRKGGAGGEEREGGYVVQGEGGGHDCNPLALSQR
jgi:hypothetical protein